MDAYLESALAKLVEYTRETPIDKIKQDLISAGHGYYSIAPEEPDCFFATNLIHTTATYGVSTFFSKARQRLTDTQTLQSSSYFTEESGNLFSSFPAEFDYKAAA